ncbi:bcl-2-like protein 15 [Epinephelus lanceolatus]
MAPTAELVEWQTTEIIKYLLEDEEEHENRCLLDAGLEVDSPGGDDDSFDPVLIADKLRAVADALDDDMRFKAALNDLKKAAAQEALDKAFSDGVDAVCQSQVSKQAEIASEVQLIRASVAFGLYVKKSCPELKGQVQKAMTSFLNRHVASWVTKQGGWDKVPDV